MSTSALASLTATYTDSEGEDADEKHPNEESPEKSSSKSPPSNNSDNRSVNSSRPTSPTSSVTVASRLTKLVSYHDDTIASEDENEVEDDIPQQIIYVNESDKSQEVPMDLDDDELLIPPEPPGSCSAELQDKINKLYEKMQTQQMDMNAVIQKRKDFRNPSIYEKLIQFCGLNELGTNYPPSIYDPLKWTKESYYEELAKVQKADMDRREKERKGKIEFTAVAKKSLEDEKNKRKSKWDMPGGGAVKINQPGLVAPPTLTTSATGTKNGSEGR
ncbi:SAP30-binding protein isoform X2 [Anthonomus grandis grandis]|uniref:SAP30-binding protein isoform X2 n=1 Tax=Anthonomus grandis grandis TaxID=2921223 RepID=UPI00216653EC|nr:SAP30-binding protein isoform X2 [Anthonomus grandis grandis]